MIAIKVVLSNGEHDEYELGNFNHGVAIESVLGMNMVIDIASGEPIAQCAGGWRWGRDIGPYEKIFFHGVENNIQKSHSINYEGELSSRSYNALNQAGFNTFEEVADHKKSWLITFIPGFGQWCAEEVRYALNAIGLDYREET